MKIYFIDKSEEHLDIKTKLEELGIENIEHKKDIKHRIYKTDYVITVDDIDFEEYKKVNNLIVVTNTLDKNKIWHMANMLNTRDIILNTKDYDYIAERIKNNIY